MTFVPPKAEEAPRKPKTLSQNTSLQSGGGWYPGDTTAGDVVFTLPALEGAVGVYRFKNMGGNTLAINAAGGATLDGEAMLELIDLYATATVVPGESEWMVF